MAVLTGVMTNDGREAFAKSFGFVAGFDLSYASFFRIGVLGYIVQGGGKVPKSPDPGLSDIEASTAAAFYVQKPVTSSDLVFVSPSIMQVRCRLEAIEANDDGSGNEPKFFELGVYDAQSVLIAYATFPEQTKAANKILTNYVQVYF